VLVVLHYWLLLLGFDLFTRVVSITICAVYNPAWKQYASKGEGLETAKGGEGSREFGHQAMIDQRMLQSKLRYLG
jgi:hypothetical protein